MSKPSALPEFTLVIDQGSHASRALVFAADGSLRASAIQEIKTERLGHDRVEHNADDILSSIELALTRVRQLLGNDAKRVTAAGLATQRSTIVCWDKFTGQALSPAISWQDRRAQSWLEGFAPHALEVHRLTGLRLSPHYGVSKLNWCLNNMSRVAAAQAQGRLFFGPLASFLAFRLLSLRPFLVDPANAGRTLLTNMRSLQWEPRLLELFGIPHACLPRCVPSYHAFGNLNFGGHFVPVRLMTGDQSAALFAQGPPRKRAVYINVGTGAFLQRVIGDAAVYHEKMLTSVVLQEPPYALYVLEGTVNGAGSALQWLAEELSMSFLERHLPEWLERPESPPLFMNGVSGLGSPYWMPNFQSYFVGMGEPWQKAVAVLESIVFLVQANIEQMQLHDGITEIVISGGLAELAGFCQRLADLSRLIVLRPDLHEATARGMSFLLSTRRKAWIASQSAVSFIPRDNPALAQRYAAWGVAMQRAVAVA